MEDKIQKGLQIYLIIDSTFTLADLTCVKKLRNIGVNLGLQGSLGKVFHEKMYVFDGEYAIVDGHNIVAAQTLSNGSNNLINDTGVGVIGPMVSEIAQRFIYHWQTLLKKPLPENILHFYAELKKTNEKYSQKEFIEDALLKKQGLCRLVTNTPGKNKSILGTYKAYVQNAKNYIFFNMIDLRFEKIIGNSIGNDFLQLIAEKANNNPQMRIDMLSNHWKLPTDIALPKGVAARQTFFSQMITKPGQLILDRPHLQISKGKKFINEILVEDNFHWWASAIYVHSKTMMIDNLVTAIGSYNINSTSESSSYEQTLICHDQELADQMQKSILHDVLNSIPIFVK
jgi:phosphatidylserine/phosphatidylglycerophosphate/cardiolipin synthase-like enzyme